MKKWPKILAVASFFCMVSHVVCATNNQSHIKTYVSTSQLLDFQALTTVPPTLLLDNLSKLQCTTSGLLFPWQSYNFLGTPEVTFTHVRHKLSIFEQFFDDFSLKQNIFYVIVLTKLCVMTCHCSRVVIKSACKLKHKIVTVSSLRLLV